MTQNRLTTVQKMNVLLWQAEAFLSRHHIFSRFAYVQRNESNAKPVKLIDLVEVNRTAENHRRNRFIPGSCLLLFSSFINILLTFSIFGTDEYEFGEPSYSIIMVPESLNFSSGRSVPISPNDQYLDFTIVDNTLVNWTPSRSFDEGIGATINEYR